MTRAAQNLLLIVLGAAVVWITLVTDEYLNYVKPGFRPLLAASAVAVIALGAVGLRREWRDSPDDAHQEHQGHRETHDDGHGHDHGRGPRVAWLLCLPALAIFVIAPPALGSFTAERDTDRVAAPPPPPAEGFGRLVPTGRPVDMTMGEFIGRSFETQSGLSNGLPDVQVRLTGFVGAARDGGWRLTRLKMSCCAGDAIPFQVTVHGPARPSKGAWVSVVGTWMPPRAPDPAGGAHDLRGLAVQPVKKPKNPYE
ncbi:TIGR03943 family putative permease subunit [Thermomonospora umbrina]|uniref:Putative repeat protein (TIGR03943 family) n=1 Tax=Thermomonospora umbrina TaxID=111806 RepID=A0A3D9SWT4_9ACTN|nr:TIGR03943 family protein [Thermomonospora umbrina]REF00048.1 putative repeat protein (TIGR03943 family) [Thermomonospora umbrina]